MEDNTVERIFAIGIEVGVIQTLKELGLIDEYMTESQAHKIYTKKLVNEWRHNRWIVGYPSGNSTRAKFHYKRSELETASRMLDIYNIIPDTKLNQLSEIYRTGKSKAVADDVALKDIRKRMNS